MAYKKETPAMRFGFKAEVKADNMISSIFRQLSMGKIQRSTI